MARLPKLEIEGKLAVFRPSGRVSIEDAVGMIKSAITLAHEQRARSLLVVTSGWTGLRSPDVAERYFFIREWARAASGAIRLAVVARPELIDPEKFGMMVAKNSGLSAAIFTSEKEALEWLDDSSSHA
jgi:hypothetical protein